MQAQSEVGAADDTRVVFRLEEASAQLDAPRGQARKAPFELRAPRAVAGHQDHQLGEAPRAVARFPPADALLQPQSRLR